MIGSHARALTLTLLVVGGFCLPPPALGQDPVLAHTLAAFNRAYQEKDWAHAIEWGHKLVDLAPGVSIHAYNVACVHALNGETEAGLDWLARSAREGFSDARLCANDPDLASLRESPVYRQALERILRNSATEFESFREQADRSEPLVVLPPGYDASKPAAIILALHPFGGTAEGIIEIWRPLAAEVGAILVAPRAVLPAREGFQWGNLDQAEYIARRAAKLVGEEIQIDESRAVITGFSQGGMMALHLGLRHADVFRGVIAVAGTYDPSQADFSSPEGRRPRFFLMVGAEDGTLESNRKAAIDLEQAGYAVKLEVYEGVGHAFPDHRDEELRKALRFVGLAPAG